MGKDYFPHLTEQVADREKTAQLIREQVNVAIVLVGPVIIGMIAFAPLLVEILYAHSFLKAVPLIQWMGLGNLLKVISWPLGFLLLAQNRSALFFTLELMWTASLLGFTWLLEDYFGLAAVGVAFLSAYIFSLAAVYWSCRANTGFTFGRSNRHLVIGYIVLTGIVFISARYDLVIGYVVGSLILLATLLNTYKKLSKMLGDDLINIVKNKLHQKGK
jgi:PST family polysaccharide transporter